jgi:predicted AAA+ superfamily ATPase
VRFHEERYDPSSMDLIPRHVTVLVEEILADTAIAVIQGARQVGKSTLAQGVLSQRASRYVSLDDPNQRAAAQLDPITFVEQFPEGCLGIDEVQRMPDLVLALKATVDLNRQPGRFLLTGSANLLRVPGTHDSLAGRAESIELFGLSQGERNGHLERFIDRAFNGELFLDIPGALDRSGYLALVCEGGYPEAVGRPTNRRRASWFDNYANRIVTRDAAEVSHLRQLGDLPKLLRLLAAHTASTVTKATLSRESGIPETTLPPYLDLLETLYLVQRIPAWSNNRAGRVAKAPKLALFDSGLAARLVNVTAASLAADMHPDPAGRLMETFVLSEVRKQLPCADTAPALLHWRDRTGPEIDIVLEAPDGRIVGIEVKAAATLRPSDFKWLAALRDTAPRRFAGGFVLYTGRNPVPFGDRLAGAPLSTLWMS